jgi:hypothetical protein
MAACKGGAIHKKMKNYRKMIEKIQNTNKILLLEKVEAKT